MGEKACLQLEIGSKTDVGRVRNNNEDTCRALPSLNLFIISDGMGGEKHGELASSIAADTIRDYCGEASDEASTSYWQFQRPDLSDKTNRLANAVRVANRKIHEAGRANPLFRGMGATVVAGWLEGSRLSLVHVGDSRAYLFRSGELQLLTSDHTLVAEQIRHRLISPENAHLSKMQNVLIRALGAQEEVEVDAAECLILNHDVIVLCTDGLTHMVTDTEIARTLLEVSDPQAIADQLVLLANEHGGQDNISVIIVRVAEMT